MAAEKDPGTIEKYTKSNYFTRLLTRRFFKCVKETLGGFDFGSILEVGCGGGFSTQYLKEFLGSRNFEASDYRVDFIEEAQKRNPDIKIQQESIYELKKGDNSFDLVVALEVLEHLENPEVALKELHRVTSKYCLVSAPNEPLWRILNVCRLKYLRDFGNTPGHLQHWSKNQFIEFLNKYFQVKKVKTPLPWIIVLAEKKI